MLWLGMKGMMKKTRVLGGLATNYYHVVSRVVDRRFVFGIAEKRHFRHLLGRLLAFSGIRCVTFCLMDNHFHLLLEVPDNEGREFKESADAELVLSRVAELYDASEMAEIEGNYRRLLASGGRSGRAAREYLQTFLDRMYDLSVLLKELKGGFTQWFNRRHNRTGTLWEGRFRSVLCEGSSGVLSMVAAYIDLNPVRAGIVSDPVKYRWSGYGEAVAGNRSARVGLAEAIDPGGERGLPWRETRAAYRLVLFGSERSRSGEKGSPELALARSLRF